MNCLLQAGNESLLQVKEFRYLLFTSEGMKHLEQPRDWRTRAAGVSLQSHLCERALSQKSLLFPTLTCSCEGLVMTEINKVTDTSSTICLGQSAMF